MVTTISGAALVLADFASLSDLCSVLTSKFDRSFSDTLLTLELMPVLICEVPGSSLILDSNLSATLLLSLVLPKLISVYIYQTYYAILTKRHK